MRYYFILLTMICILGLPLAADIYGGDSANVIKESKSSAAIAEQYPDTETQSGEKNTINNKADNANFSDYPKSFVIPKGVCETNEPAMIINR